MLRVKTLHLRLEILLPKIAAVENHLHFLSPRALNVIPPWRLILTHKFTCLNQAFLSLIFGQADILLMTIYPLSQLPAPQFRLGDFLIGILPGYSGKKRSGLFLDPVIKTGKDSSLGWFGETSLNHSWNDLTTSTKLTYYLDRGFFISPVFSYNKSYDDGFFNSTVTGGWINDQADRLSADARNYPLERNRGYSHFSSTSRHKDRLRSSTLIEWESDSEIIRDFKRSQFYGNQWNQSHNEFSYEGDGYTISILTRWQANNHEAIVEQLPLLNLDFGPSKLGDTKLFQSTSLNYANLDNRRPIRRNLIFHTKNEPGSQGRETHFTLGWS